MSAIINHLIEIVCLIFNILEHLLCFYVGFYFYIASINGVSRIDRLFCCWFETRVIFGINQINRVNRVNWTDDKE